MTSSSVLEEVLVLGVGAKDLADINLELSKPNTVVCKKSLTSGKSWCVRLRYSVAMPLPPPRITQLPPELIAQAAELLRQNTAEARLAAAQLLARGYEQDEERRLAGLVRESGEE